MHKIDAFKTVMGRAVEVRGKLFAFDKLDPERSALVVVDMQNVFVAKGQVVEVPEARSIVDNINELAAAFRGRGILLCKSGGQTSGCKLYSPRRVSRFPD